MYERTRGVDGCVSLEVSPLLAHDTKTTLAVAKDLHARAGRPNLFIKIPGTKEGIPAIEEAIFAGVPVNVTLLFSREHYVAAAEAYLRGIERRIAAGLTADVGSVASLFISRWDVAVASKVPAPLVNKLGIAIGKRSYKAYCDLLGIAALPPRDERGRASAAPAVREHRHQGSEGVRRAVRRGACRALHGQHDAGEDAARRRRPRQHRCGDAAPTAAIAKRCSRNSRRPGSTSTRSRRSCRTKAPTRS